MIPCERDKRDNQLWGYGMIQPPRTIPQCTGASSPLVALGYRLFTCHTPGEAGTPIINISEFSRFQFRHYGEFDFRCQQREDVGKKIESRWMSRDCKSAGSIDSWIACRTLSDP